MATRRIAYLRRLAPASAKSAIRASHNKSTKLYACFPKVPIPVAIQIAMQGAYGATDYGGFMAMLVLAIIPIIIFYISSQKYIIKGVISGAVKG